MPNDATALKEAELFANLCELLEKRTHPRTLFYSGVTAVTLIRAGLTVSDLVKPRGRQHPVDSHYYLEHLILGFELTFSDLMAMGFTLRHLRDSTHFPLVALTRYAKLTAEQLFRLNISYAALDRHVLSIDSRHARLLDLNLPFWKAALSAQA